MFSNSIEKFSRNLTWRAHFFLNPPSNTINKETFGFKSLTPTPYVKELKNFEEGLVCLVKDTQFENRHNTFQNKLEKDIKEIKKEKRIFVAGDKSTNFHKMTPQMYNQLLNKSIQKVYKKAPPRSVKNIEKSHSEIVKSLELQDRVFRTTERHY